MDGTNPGPERKERPLDHHKLDIYKKIIRELVASSDLDEDAPASIGPSPDSPSASE